MKGDVLISVLSLCVGKLMFKDVLRICRIVDDMRKVQRQYSADFFPVLRVGKWN